MHLLPNRDYWLRVILQISHQCYSHSAFPDHELTCTPLLSFSTLLCLHFALLEILLTAAVTLTQPGSGCPHWHLGRWACFPRLTRWTPLMNKITSQAANKGEGRRSVGCVLPGRTHRVVALTVVLLQTNQGAQVFLCQIKRWNKHLMTGWRWRMCWDSNSYPRDGAETWSRTDRWSRARQEGRLAETGTNQVGNRVPVQVQVVERLAWMGRRSDKWLSVRVWGWSLYEWGEVWQDLLPLLRSETFSSSFLNDVLPTCAKWVSEGQLYALNQLLSEFLGAFSQK